MEGVKTINENRFQLCGNNGCCPEIEIDASTGAVKITDDNGGSVTLTKEQSLLLKSVAVEKF